jgi:hypothetical protein
VEEQASNAPIRDAAFSRTPENARSIGQAAREYDSSRSDDETSSDEELFCRLCGKIAVMTDHIISYQAMREALGRNQLAEFVRIAPVLQILARKGPILAIDRVGAQAAKPKCCSV